MKLSLNWIKDYVDLPASLTASQIEHDLTLATVEVEGHEDIAQTLDSILVGQISEVRPHPDADRLRIVICELDAGRSEEIVCGGSNLEVGQKVAVAIPGAKVRWHGEGDLIEIKLSAVRGVKSYGMICSASEIGLDNIFPPAGEKDIIDLTPVDPEVGKPLAEALALNDVIFEIDNKSLTNRPDLWGHYGMARELAAIYNLSLKPLETFDLPSQSGGLNVAIDDESRCYRYSATAIEGVEVTESPFWLRSRLGLLGQRPINFLVDLTNYVMFAVGQPSHAFDAEQLQGTLHIRGAKDAEKAVLLDGQTLDLNTESLVIADDKQTVALAGVMGGGDASVSEQTQNLVLEVANFNALQVRQDSTRYSLRTESSSRFEKGLDPALVDTGLQLLLSLLVSEQPQVSITGYVDCYPVKNDTVELSVSKAFLLSRLGKDLSTEEMIATLTRLGFEVAVTQQDAEDILHVKVPSWRATGDVSLAEDIVEEVARLYGYDNFDFVPPEVALKKAISQPKRQLERKLREYFAYRGNMQEIVGYPWVDDKYLQAAGVEELAAVRLFAPPTPESQRLQPSLVPQMLKAVCANTRFFSEFKLFEVNRVFLGETTELASDEVLPLQPKRLAAAWVGDNAPALFLEAKGLLTQLSHTLQLAEVRCESVDGERRFGAPWADSNGQLALCDTTTGEQVGVLAAVSAKTMRLSDIKHTKVILCEIDIEKLQPHTSRENRFTSLSEHPHSEYDLSLMFDVGVEWQAINDASETANELVRSVEFVDEYRGEQIPAGKKSVTLRLTIGADAGTLTSEQIEVVAQAVNSKLTALGGELRG